MIFICELIHYNHSIGIVTIQILIQGWLDRSRWNTTFKKGGFILEICTKLSIIPIEIIGTDPVLPKKLLKLHKGDIKFIIGETLYLRQQVNNKMLTQNSDVIVKITAVFTLK